MTQNQTLWCLDFSESLTLRKAQSFKRRDKGNISTRKYLNLRTVKCINQVVGLVPKEPIYVSTLTGACLKTPCTDRKCKVWAMTKRTKHCLSLKKIISMQLVKTKSYQSKITNMTEPWSTRNSISTRDPSMVSQNWAHRKLVLRIWMPTRQWLEGLQLYQKSLIREDMLNEFCNEWFC